MNENTKEILTREELAEYIGTSTRTISNWQKSRCIPFIRIGRCIRFRKSAVDAALAKFEWKAI